MKKIAWIIIVLVLIIFSGCSKVSPTSKADYPYYPTIESATNKADIFIIGKIDKVIKGKNINISKNDDARYKYTVSDVLVEEVIKGNSKPGDKIQVKQLDIQSTQVRFGLKRKPKHIPEPSQVCLVQEVLSMKR